MTKAVQVVLFAIVVVSIPLVLSADMYSWTDENGVKHFSNVKPSQTEDDVKEETEIVSTESRETTDGKEGSPANDRAGSQDKAVYCQKSLQRCKDQHVASYTANVKLCEGDWSATSELSKAFGKNISAKEHYEACRKTFKDKKQEGIQSCEKAYSECMR